jgi:hypothetical protein
MTDISSTVKAKTFARDRCEFRLLQGDALSQGTTCGEVTLNVCFGISAAT